MASHDADLEPTSTAPSDPESDEQQPDGAPRDRRVRHALTFGIPVAIALAALTGWLGFQSFQVHQDTQTRNLFIQAARQGAMNLTTLSYSDINANVQRILDSSTGTFHDDFQSRKDDFVNAVQSAKSTSTGTVTEAALQSQDGSAAKVMVAVTVKMSNAGAPEQQPRTWRMRLDVQRTGDTAKVSNVEFVA